MNPPTRYLQVQPQGITEWLTRAPDARQPDQRLFRALLRQPHNATPVGIAHLSGCSGLSRTQVAQALFGLHRRGSIRVSVDASAPPGAPDAADHPATDIHRQLRKLCEPTAGAAVLADPDGLCLASHGVAHDEAQGLAAGVEPLRHAMVRTVPLFVGQRPCRLYVTASTLLEHEALVRLVRRLCELLPDAR